MITQQQIDDLVEWDGLKKFGAFMLSYCEEGQLPDFNRIDLMQVPRLVPYIWVYDLRTEEKTQRLAMGFAGERHTEMHGRNVSGMGDAVICSAYGFSDEVVEFYHKAIRERKVGYNRRDTVYDDGFDTRHHNLECLFFPCSSDGETVNYGVGCLNWSTTFTKSETLYRYF
ncbi:MAG: hypothetical protein RIC16_05500 [Rhodospirillales bacterium]